MYNMNNMKNIYKKIQMVIIIKLTLCGLIVGVLVKRIKFVVWQFGIKYLVLLVVWVIKLECFKRMLSRELVQRINIMISQLKIKYLILWAVWVIRLECFKRMLSRGSQAYIIIKCLSMVIFVFFYISGVLNEGYCDPIHLADLDPVSHPESHPEPHPESHPEPHSDSHPESHPDSHPDSHPESQLESHLEHHPESHPESQLESHPQPNPEPTNARSGSRFESAEAERIFNEGQKEWSMSKYWVRQYLASREYWYLNYDSVEEWDAVRDAYFAPVYSPNHRLLEDSTDSSNSASNGYSLFCLVRFSNNKNAKANKANTNNLFPEFPKTQIRKISTKTKQKPLKGLDGIITESPNLKELTKQIFFPLSHLHKYIYRKESLLTEQSIAYLNTVHPNKNKQKSRVKLKKQKTKTSTKHRGRVSSSNITDVIYEYLKTFSNYSIKKKGVLINFNQHIGYNFNRRNLLLRGVESPNNNSLQVKTNKNQSTNAFPFAFSVQLEKKAQVPSVPSVESVATVTTVPSVPKATENMNKNINININYPLNKPLLGLYPDPESNKNTPIASVANVTEESNAPAIVQSEIPKDIVLIAEKLNRIKGISEETGYNPKGNNKLIKYTYKLLFYFFKSMYCLISKPVFIFSPDKVVIQLQYFINIPKFKVFKWYSILKFKPISEYKEKLIRKKNQRFNRFRRYSKRFGYRKKKRVHWKVKRTLIRLVNKQTNVQNILFNLNKYNLFKVFSLKFKLICDILNKKFNKPVELHLIRLHKPYLDSNILVNLLSLNIKNKKFRANVKIRKLFQKRIIKNVEDHKNQSVNYIPAFVSGIKIRIGGRLMREFMIPKISTKKYERGASSVGKVNFLDIASVTKKNRKGSYTLKISTGQNLF